MSPFDFIKNPVGKAKDPVSNAALNHLQKIGNMAAGQFIDKAAEIAEKPGNISKAKHVIASLDQSAVGSQLAQRLDQGLEQVVKAAEHRNEAQRLELEAKKKHMRWIGAAEAIGGSFALVGLLAFIIFCWNNEEWSDWLTGKDVIAIAVGLIVSAGLIIAGIRTLFTARG